MPSDNASRLARVLDDYLDRAAAGMVPDQQALLAENPEMADSLRACLASLEWIDAAARDRGEVIDRMAGDLDAPPHNTLGDFRLLRVIARGGMGVVYEAEQQSLGRRVALKILPLASMLDPRQRQRFLNEAHAAAQLNHPNIIDVIAVGCERGVHFYAMRLVDGPTLAQVIAEARQAGGTPESAGHIEASGTGQCAGCIEIKQTSGASQQIAAATESYHGQIPPERLDLPDGADAGNPKSSPGVPGQNLKSTVAGLSTESPREYCRSVARLMVEVARALDYAHQVGVIHRDVKPSNILLDSRGKAWVTDFGLARLETNGELTMTGDLLGTLRYMSPEQLLGQRAAVDHRTDVYSLGATLYELLTLRPAFAAPDRAELLRQISVEPPRPPRKFIRSLPAELETIALKALEKNPADRYRTAGDLADDLQRFLDHRPIHARRSRVVAHAKSLWRRHQVLFVGVITTLLLASSAASVLVWRQWKEAVAQHALVIERDAVLRDRLYAADVRAAHQAWQRGDVTRAQELLDRYAGLGGDELREFAWYYLSSLLSARPAPLAVLRPGHGNIYCVQFSPDGRLLAAACDDGHVQLWNAADRSLRHSLAAHQADADCVAFSPDSKLLISGGEDAWLRFWSVDTGKLLRSIEAGQKDTLTIAISPDGQTLAAGGIDGLVRLWQLPKGTPRGEYRASGGRVQHLAFSPDGARLATAGSDSNSMLVDVATQARVLGLPSQLTAAFAVAFSPKGDEIALGSGTGLVALVDASSGRAQSLLGIRAGQVRAVAFSPTAPRLASAGLSGVVDLWDTASGSLLAKLHGHGQRIWSLAYSPDGKQIASAGNDGSVHIWNAQIESGMAHARNEQPIYEVKFAAGGKRLVTATDKRELVSWDAAALDRITAQPLPARTPPAIAFAPDRRAYVAYSGDGEVWLGEMTGAAPRPFPPVRKAPVEKMALAGNARLLAWYTDGALEVWDTTTERLLDRRQVGRCGSWPAALSRDGRLVAIVSAKHHADDESHVLLYDADSLHARTLPLPAPVDPSSVAISPDNLWLAAAAADGSVLFVDIRTGDSVFSLTGHQSSVDALAFSADGRTLASASRGGSVRLWHLSTREELFAIHRIDSGGMLHIDFSPDSHRLVAATGDRESHGHIYLWPASSTSSP